MCIWIVNSWLPIRFSFTFTINCTCKVTNTRMVHRNFFGAFQTYSLLGFCENSYISFISKIFQSERITINASKRMMVEVIPIASEFVLTLYHISISAKTQNLNFMICFILALIIKENTASWYNIVMFNRNYVVDTCTTRVPCILWLLVVTVHERR